MAQMKPAAAYFTAYHIDTDCADEIVPESVCGKLALGEPLSGETRASLFKYLEGTEFDEVICKVGWYSRLSASGYRACTEWIGPYETEVAALTACKNIHNVDDDGNDVE